VFQLSFTQNFETQVGQVLNSKVVDQLTLYHFYKDRIGFRSTNFAQKVVELCRNLGSSE
jgi:hypothetical protein